MQWLSDYAPLPLIAIECVASLLVEAFKQWANMQQIRGCHGRACVERPGSGRAWSGRVLLARACQWSRVQRQDRKAVRRFFLSLGKKAFPVMRTVDFPTHKQEIQWMRSRSV